LPFSLPRAVSVCLSVRRCLYVYILKTSPLSPQWSRVTSTQILYNFASLPRGLSVCRFPYLYIVVHAL